MSNLSNDLEAISWSLADGLEKRKIYLRQWNEQNKPVLESTDADDRIQGAFYLQDRWWFGTKYKNGYHPEELIQVPNVVVQAIRAQFEKEQKLKEQEY